MKTFIFLFSMAVFGLTPKNVFSQSAKIEIKDNQVVSVDEVFKLIKNQTDYTFIYRANLFENSPKISLKKGIFKANKLLDMALSGGEFIYEFSQENTIVIKSKVSKKEPVAKDENIVQKAISGNVIDEKGESLPGVTVQLKNTKIAVITDFDGNFTINLGNSSESPVLVFSYIGYEKTEIPVGTKTVIGLKMTPILGNLDEVVVIGYGTTKVKDATGSISRITAADIDNAPMGATVESLLQGRAAGVSVQIQSASPTSPISVIIRGQSSLSGNNQPLWVIDGVPQYADTYTGGVSNPLGSMNLDDIQSIDILKDASATAVYGSRAANGVVMVTTKKGKIDKKATVEISTRVGLTVRDFNKYQYYSAEGYKTFTTAASKASILSYGFNDYSAAFIDKDAFIKLNTSEYDASVFQVAPGAYYDNDINWQDEMTQNPVVIQRNFSVRGGSALSTYSVSFNYSDVDGIMKGGKSELYGGRFNFDTQISKSLKFGVNLNGSSRVADDKDAMLSGLRNTRPDLPQYNADGSIFTADIYTENPLTTLKNTSNGKGIVVNATGYLDYTLFKGLILRGAYTNNYSDNETLSYHLLGSSDNNPFNNRSWSSSKTTFNVLESTLSYVNTFNKKHDINAVLGYTTESSNRRNMYIFGQNFPDDEILNSFTSAAEIVDVTEAITDNALVSQFARAHYKFDGRYIISGTIRRDGSSRFGPDKRWGIFPSGAIAWVISEEGFMKGIKKNVPYLKLRSSMGFTGSQNLGNFDWTTLVNSTTYNDSPAISPSTLGNPDLQWEQTKLFDLGLDFGLFQHRLSGTVGIYNKISDNLLYNQPIASSSSFSSVTSNIASIGNKGFEFDIKYNIVQTKNSQFSFNFNWSKNVTKVLGFNGTITEIYYPGSYAPYVKLVEGGEIGQWYGYETSGRLYVNSEDMYADRTRVSTTGQTQYLSTQAANAGDLMFKDQNGDGLIDLNDRVNIGSSTPLGYGGFGLSYQHKGFNVNANFSYAYGHKRFWNLPFTDMSNTRHYNQSNIVAGKSTIFYSPYEADFPRMGPGMSQNAKFSDYFLHDASYIRMTALNATYRLPSEIFTATALKGVTLAFQASNLFTFTKYPGFDPQGNFSNSNLGSGMSIDSSKYPAAQIYSLGVTFNFQ